MIADRILYVLVILIGLIVTIGALYFMYQGKTYQFMALGVLGILICIGGILLAVD